MRIPKLEYSVNVLLSNKQRASAYKKKFYNIKNLSKQVHFFNIFYSRFFYHSNNFHSFCNYTKLNTLLVDNQFSKEHFLNWAKKYSLFNLILDLSEMHYCVEESMREKNKTKYFNTKDFYITIIISQTPHLTLLYDFFLSPPLFKTL